MSFAAFIPWREFYFRNRIRTQHLTLVGNCVMATGWPWFLYLFLVSVLLSVYNAPEKKWNSFLSDGETARTSADRKRKRLKKKTKWRSTCLSGRRNSSNSNPAEMPDWRWPAARRRARRRRPELSNPRWIVCSSGRLSPSRQRSA